MASCNDCKYIEVCKNAQSIRDSIWDMYYCTAAIADMEICDTLVKQVNDLVGSYCENFDQYTGELPKPALSELHCLKCHKQFKEHNDFCLYDITDYQKQNVKITLRCGYCGHQQWIDLEDRIKYTIDK